MDVVVHGTERCPVVTGCPFLPHHGSNECIWPYNVVQDLPGNMLHRVVDVKPEAAIWRKKTENLCETLLDLGSPLLNRNRIAVVLVRLSRVERGVEVAHSDSADMRIPEPVIVTNCTERLHCVTGD
jgi:hypothetical protein